MTRKSRNCVIENKNTSVFRVAGYVRLSVFKEEGENTSIQNQKNIIDDYIKNKPDMILEKWYVDEAASGRNFRRDAFEEMLEDLEDGKVNCIIIKDLSRFSRDFIGAGYYIEKYFPLNNIRFISITEKLDTWNNIYDTDDYGNSRHNFRLTNALNEAVAKDISIKTSAKLNVLAKEGCFIAPRAPYGFIKETKHKLGIDSDAAIVVRHIFEMASENIGITEITRRLNQEDILTPMEYAISKGAKGNYSTGTGKWSTRTVKDILTNITFAGHLCQGKDRITVYNTHQAIIEQDLFDKVEEALKVRSNNTIQSNNSVDKEENALKGKIICGCCGNKLQRRKGSGNSDWHYFTCITNNRQGAGSCDGMYIRESEIIDKIKRDINAFIDATEPKIKKTSAEKQELRRQMFMFDMKDAKSNIIKASYLHQFNDGKITKDDFRVKADELIYHTEEIAKLDNEIKALDALREKYNFYAKVREGKDQINKFLKECVEKIVVNSKENIDRLILRC